jgi:hypothetical protein
MSPRGREPYRTVPVPRNALLRAFLVSTLVACLLCAIALWLGGCDERRDSSAPHCETLYERGHVQPCRER